MKCACKQADCAAEYNLDSVSGILIVSGDAKIPGVGAAYIDVAGAVKLSRQLQEFVLRQMRAEVEP